MTGRAAQHALVRALAVVAVVVGLLGGALLAGGTGPGARTSLVGPAPAVAVSQFLVRASSVSSSSVGTSSASTSAVGTRRAQDRHVAARTVAAPVARSAASGGDGPSLATLPSLARVAQTLLLVQRPRPPNAVPPHGPGTAAAGRSPPADAAP